MASKGTTAGDGEERRECGLPVVRPCTFSEGNDTEFPFPLSIHGAWMLDYGIREYARNTKRMHEEGMEDPSYCRLMTDTAIRQAEKLRAWAEGVDPAYLEGTIQELGELLEELASERDRYEALALREQAGEAKGPDPSDLPAC